MAPGQFSFKSSAGGTLDFIAEVVIDLHNRSSKESAVSYINRAIRVGAKHERNLRASTITLLKRTTSGFSSSPSSSNADRSYNINHDLSDSIIKFIEENWIIKQKRPHVTTWQDNGSLYCEFVSPNEKNSFLDAMMTNQTANSFKCLLVPPVEHGIYFKRKPVKIELPSVKRGINANKIYESLTSSAATDCVFSPIKEGKVQTITGVRSLMLEVNAAAFKHLFGQLHGLVPYISSCEPKVNMKIPVKINIRPYVCNHCYKIGKHDCRGKACSKCGDISHDFKNCTQTKSFCKNCNRSGHKAKDLTCPSYLYQMIKQLRKVDVPMEYYEDEELRFELVSSLLLK